MPRLKQSVAKSAKSASTATGSVCALSGVSRRFGDLEAVCGLTLEIAAGERVAIVGPSGAGKSTLLGLLNGSLAPTHGHIRLLGCDPWGLGPRQRRRLQRQIGTIYQQHHLVGNLAVVHNVNAGRLGYWSLLQAARSLLWPQTTAAAAALARVGIAEKLYERTDRLSGGQQQRVAIARVLVQDPVLILADEPTASLDPTRARDLMALLCDLAATGSKTLVTSLHDIELALAYCTRLIGLRRGQLQFDLPRSRVSSAAISDLYDL